MGQHEARARSQSGGLPTRPPAARWAGNALSSLASPPAQATIDGYLPEGGRARFVMGVAEDQFVEMDAAVGTTGQGLRFSIVGADGFVVRPMGPAHVKTVVPSTQDYLISVRAESGIGANYSLEITIPAARPGPGISLVGTVLDVSPSARTITLAGPVHGFTVVALAAECQVLSPSGRQILLRDLQPGSRIEASGQRGAPGALIADQVCVLAD